MDLINRIIIKAFCKKVGADEFGNEYFENKNKKRFVVYKGIVEPSKIPAEWHGWMHYSSDKAPVDINTHRFLWQKSHLPNLTGTRNSHSPEKSKTKNTQYGYQAWKPNN